MASEFEFFQFENGLFYNYERLLSASRQSRTAIARHPCGLNLSPANSVTSVKKPIQRVP